MIVRVGLLDKSDDYISRLANYQADGSNKEGKSVSTGHFFRDWNRWNDRFSCCGSLFGTNPAQAGEKAEGADLERVSIKSNRGV